MNQHRDANESREDAIRCAVTRLTSDRRGAVGVISIDGPDATELVARQFVPVAGKPLEAFPLGRIVFGGWTQSSGAAEEVVVCRRSEQQIEVSCHGGAAAARALIETLTAVGARESTAAEWVDRHVPDSLAAEALLALADARTERVAAILLDQYRGALRQTLTSTIDQLQRDEFAAAAARLQRLIELGLIGKHLNHPWRVLFAGPPNAGKSSLINCVLGYERSIVFDQPGTTRDLLSATTVLEGWPVELVDSAGLRSTGDAVEVEGVTRAEALLAQADLIVLVLDATMPFDERVDRLVRQARNALVVANKQDLTSEADRYPASLRTSAVTGEGVKQLMASIVARIVTTRIEPGEAVPFTETQLRAIQDASDAITSGKRDKAVSLLQSLVAR